MAGPLAAVERFFERLFERPAARLFQTHVEQVHIQRGLERAMESERRVHARQAYAPSAFRVLLNAADAAALEGQSEAMVRDLGEQMRVYARAHDYILLARPHVELHPSPSVAVGDLRVYATPVALNAADVRSNGGGRSQRPASAPLAPDPPVPAQDAVPAADAVVGLNTAIYAAPQTNAPHAQLAVRSPGQPVSRVPVRAGTIRIGRSLDNDIVLADEKVSRHHGQIGVRLGMLVYTDLGSTNGSLLHGRAVTEIALGPGDILQLASSTVTIEPAT